MDLLEMLARYAASGACPMHMPGHKRRALGGGLPWQMDITEIDGFDNLHDAHGVLKESMDRAARLYGSDRAFFLVNGSTCGILAGICAAARPGGYRAAAKRVPSGGVSWAGAAGPCAGLSSGAGGRSLWRVRQCAAPDRGRCPGGPPRRQGCSSLQAPPMRA